MIAITTKSSTSVNANAHRPELRDMHVLTTWSPQKQSRPSKFYLTADPQSQRAFDLNVCFDELVIQKLMNLSDS